MGRHIAGLSGSLKCRQQRKASLQRPQQYSSSMSAKGMGRSSNILGATVPLTTAVRVAALMWALCWVGTATSSRGVATDADLLEAETGWQFSNGNTIESFDNATSNATAPAAAPKSGVITLINADFELTNITGNATVTADATSTAIVNWTPGGAGVQILQSNTYGKLDPKVKSTYCIHLNVPTSTNANGTQGSLTTNLAVAPASGKWYTVQYETARNPDGPINLWSALRISAMQAGVAKNFVVRQPVYNSSDTQGHSTWVRQSFTYQGTGSAMAIKFESMTEKYGPIIDNVEILSGLHELAAAPLGKVSGLCQRILPAFSLLALALSHLL